MTKEQRIKFMALRKQMYDQGVAKQFPFAAFAIGHLACEIAEGVLGKHGDSLRENTHENNRSSIVCKSNHRKSRID